MVVNLNGDDMKYYSVCFKRNADKTIIPVTFIEHSENVVKTTPFQRQRELAANWTARHGADVFAFYAGGARSTMFIDANNEIDFDANAPSAGPALVMRIREIKRNIKQAQK